MNETPTAAVGFTGWTVRSITRRDGVAGQYALDVVAQWEDDEPTRVTFTSSTDGAPVVLIGRFAPDGVIVSDAGRFGDVLDESWVRRFYA